MFPSFIRDFNDDPFFRGPMETMRRMESMFNSLSPLGGMFGAMGLPSPDDTGLTGQQNGRSFQDRTALMPFGFGRSLFPNMDDMFANFNQLGQIGQNQLGQIGQNPNCHSYASSTVMTYTTDESGRPQVYQASSSTRTAPGGVKETRKAVQDTRTGVQKMAIGHHLNDRAHIVEKKKNRYTGDEEENHELVNLEDEEAETFDSEWQQKAQTYASRPTCSSIGNGSRWRERSPARPNQPQMLAITDGSGEKPHKQKRVKHSSPSHKPGHSRRPTPYE